MDKNNYKKFAIWTAISVASGSLVGGLLPLLMDSQWPHQLATKVVLMLMTHKI